MFTSHLLDHWLEKTSLTNVKCLMLCRLELDTSVSANLNETAQCPDCSSLCEGFKLNKIQHLVQTSEYF